MVSKEFSTEAFPDAAVQAAAVGEWRGRYDRLLEVLGRLGTQVMVDRVLETDIAVDPGKFIRNAHHQFIFPPQDVTLEDDASTTIDPSPATKLVREAKWWTYDPEAVRGLISVHYDDSASRIDFSVKDERGDSYLPDEAEYEIGVAFSQAAPEQTV